MPGKGIRTIQKRGGSWRFSKAETQSQLLGLREQELQGFEHLPWAWEMFKHNLFFYLHNSGINATVPIL